MNQFAGVLTSATAAVAEGLNTQTPGQPVIVYNPLNINHVDVAEATVSLRPGPNETVVVFGPNGRPVPTQIIGEENGKTKILFQAVATSVGYIVFDARLMPARDAATKLKVTESSLENERYRISLNNDGDVASIFDKELNREILSAPIRLAIKNDTPAQWPAWNMDWTDQQKPPRAYVSGPAKIRVVERGPVRAAIEVVRETEGSKFQQTVGLSTGAGENRIEFSNVIDWKTANANLKVTFPLAAANDKATYNGDVGTIERGNNDERKFEVPSHQWFDLTDRSGTFGVSVLSDCKYGSDKPDDNTLRLTLLRTPGIAPRAGYADQSSQDWGHHEFVYALLPHAGDWRQGGSQWEGQRLNQPLIAFESSKHAGRLGKSFSILRVDDMRVRVLALKKAEDSDELIVRIVDLDGREIPFLTLDFAAPVMAAREVDAQERTVGKATAAFNRLVTSLGKYQVRTFAVKLAKPRTPLFQPQSQPIALPYNLTVADFDGERMKEI